jgi:hypothetical protein
VVFSRDPKIQPPWDCRAPEREKCIGRLLKNFHLLSLILELQPRDEFTDSFFSSVIPSGVSVESLP